MQNSTFRLAVLLGSTASSRGSRAAEGGRLSPMLRGTFNCFVFSHVVIKPNTTTVYFSHALQKVCLQMQGTHTYNYLSGPRLSVPSPNRQEQRAPQYPLRPHPPNRMSPRLGYFKRGKPPSDSLQSCNVVSLISHPREIDPRHRKKKNSTFRLALLLGSTSP